MQGNDKHSVSLAQRDLNPRPCCYEATVSYLEKQSK